MSQIRTNIEFVKEEIKKVKIYVRNKSKACQDVGVEYEEILLSSDTTMKKLLDF